MQKSASAAIGRKETLPPSGGGSDQRHAPAAQRPGEGQLRQPFRQAA